MNLPLENLETRRKILFSEGSVTVRNLSSESVLLSIGFTDITKRQLKTVENFLANHFRERAMATIVIDLSEAGLSMLPQVHTLAALEFSQFSRLAFLTKNRLIKAFVSVLTSRKKLHGQIKFFASINHAISWALAKR